MKKLFITFFAMLAGLSALAQGWPANYGGVMLQGFYWDSYDWTKWENLTARAPELGALYDIIWIPNSATPSGGNKEQSMGYMPYSWLKHTTIFGSETKLKTMIQTYGAMGTGFIEDLVLNHKAAKEASNGKFLAFLDESRDGYSITWDNENFTGIVSNDDVSGGGGNADTGDGFDGARDLDHTNSRVQQNCITYQRFLLEYLGYVGFRLDMTKGYAPQYTGMYNAATNPTFSVAEYFDGNVDLVKGWIQGTAVNGQIQSGAFDFPLKFKINEAFGNGSDNWTALHLAGLIADNDMKRYAVTFVDNHDTNEDHNKLYANWEAANAFILAMPGTPCIFSKHYDDYTEAITNCIKGRRAAGITNQSACQSTLYDNNRGIIFETTGTKGSVIIRLGDAATDGTPNLNQYELVQRGTKYAFYVTKGLDWQNSQKNGMIIGHAIIDKASGVYANSVAVTIRPSSAGTTLVYTTDGTNPSATSTQITSATTLTFTENTTLKVGVLMDGQVIDVVTRNYIIGTADPTSITVYVKADAAPYLYVWDGGGGALNGSWPGKKMSTKKTVGGVEFYTTTFAKSSSEYAINCVINSGNDQPQSSDLTEIANDVFYSYKVTTTDEGSEVTVRDLSSIYLLELYNPFVSIDKGSGELPADAKVNLTASYADATIVYTTDGSTPTASSSQATGSKELSFTTVGSNVTVKAGILADSKVVNVVSRTFNVVEATGSGSTSDGITIYCKASSAPYLYVWDTSGELNAAWPGTKMTTTKTIDGTSFYYKKFNKSNINIIFNDGNGNQTADITGITADAYFNYNGSTSATNITSQYAAVEIPSSATVLDDALYCYFEASTYYEPFLWAWDDGGGNYSSGTWPGTALVDVVGVAPSGKNIYRWNYGALSENVPTGLVFSNYGSPQTTDFVFTNGGYYTENGLVGVVTYRDDNVGVLGDVNGDGQVTAADVLAVYDLILGVTTENQSNADVNGDGQVTAADVSIIYGIILGAN